MCWGSCAFLKSRISQFRITHPTHALRMVIFFYFQTARNERNKATTGLNTYNGRLLWKKRWNSSSQSKTIISSVDNSTLATLSSVGNIR